MSNSKPKRPWIKVRFEVFPDLGALTTEEKMARSVFLLDSSRRDDMRAELRFMIRPGKCVERRR